jgi:hypothetical protein
MSCFDCKHTRLVVDNKDKDYSFSCHVSQKSIYVCMCDSCDEEFGPDKSERWSLINHIKEAQQCHQCHEYFCENHIVSQFNPQGNCFNLCDECLKNNNVKLPLQTYECLLCKEIERDADFDICEEHKIHICQECYDKTEDVQNYFRHRKVIDKKNDSNISCSSCKNGSQGSKKHSS